MESWISEELSDILDFHAPQDLVEYVLSIDNARDLEDFLKTLLNFENPRHRQFYADLIKRHNSGTRESDFKSNRKSDGDNNSEAPKQGDKKKKSNIAQAEENIKKNVKASSPQDASTQGKKKTKFINLYSPEGQTKDVVFLKGRVHCECQATKHKLVNNCLKCGRIVCAQEGSGPCLFCGELVCTAEEQRVLDTGTKQAESLRQKLVNQKKPPDVEAALEQRDRLLEYDRTSERRTRVIDDESDYFGLNSTWLTKEERNKLKKKEQEERDKKYGSRLNKKFTLDFAGRQVFEESEDYSQDDSQESVFSDITNTLNNFDLSGDNLHPGFSGPAPVFQESVSKTRTTRNESPSIISGIHRVQDLHFLEMSDDGMCLSMHQPWASLLVAGIKKHEGRTWYTSHRGRLWIASASKVPLPEEVRNVEHMYEVLNEGDHLHFPEHYPTSCLLGCVSVVDCLPQEEYRTVYPEGESDCPYVFICEDPHQLPISLPMTGKHKIYKLDPKIHQVAQKSLQRMLKLEADNVKIM